MATPAEILAAGGLTNADLIVQAASATGLPLPILAAMVQKESGGQNVYGHDADGVFSTLYGSVTVEGVTYGKGANIPVTQSNFAEFRRQVIDNGKTSNGVGPCQITYWGFFAQNPTYEFWDALQNLKFGADLVKSYLAGDTSDASISAAGARYNGGTTPGEKALAYGADLLTKTNAWRAKLASASDIGGSMPKVFLSPSDQDNNAVDGGGVEQQYAQLRCARAAEVLRAHGVTVKVSEAGIGDDGNGYVASVKEGEAWGPDIYVADHTNATGTANRASGVQAYCWLADPNSKRLGKCINARMDPIVPGGASIQDGSGLYEVSGPSATAVLMESGYHDNPVDAAVIRTKTTEMGEALAYGILDYFGIQTTTPSEEEDIMSTESTALLGTIADRLLVVSDALTTGKEGVKFDGDVIACLRSIESKLDALATTTEPERAEPEPAIPAETAPVTGATAIREALATARAALSIIEANL